MDKFIQPVFDGILNGDPFEVQQGINSSLEQNIDAKVILETGMISAMKEVGRLFEEGEFYVPEMLIAARAMQSGLTILRPLLQQTGFKAKGRVVLGTVKGDLHDIGKNLVSIMLEGSGFEVIDIGVDASPEKFADAVRDYQPDIVAMSALLTTTMSNMKTTIEFLEQQGIRDQVKILVGGAPVTETFTEQIGADGFAPDGGRAVSVALSFLPA